MPEKYQLKKLWSIVESSDSVSSLRSASEVLSAMHTDMDRLRSTTSALVIRETSGTPAQSMSHRMTAARSPTYLLFVNTMPEGSIVFLTGHLSMTPMNEAHDQDGMPSIAIDSTGSLACQSSPKRISSCHSPAAGVSPV